MIGMVKIGPIWNSFLLIASYWFEKKILSTKNRSAKEAMTIKVQINSLSSVKMILSTLKYAQ